MTIFDYLVLFVLIASIVISTLRGLVKEILSLVSWVVAFVVANMFGAQLAALLPPAIPGEVMRLIVAFIALFIGVRLLMGLLMMARGIVIVLAGVIVAGMTDLPKQAFWKQALFSPIAETGVRTVKPYLPASVVQHVNY